MTKAVGWEHDDVNGRCKIIYVAPLARGGVSWLLRFFQTLARCARGW